MIKALEAQRNQKRRSLFDAHDQVDAQREELIAAIEGKLAQTRLCAGSSRSGWSLEFVAAQEAGGVHGNSRLITRRQRC